VSKQYTLTNGSVLIYVRDDVAQGITLTATDGQSKTGNAAVTVVPGVVTHYDISEPTSATAGVDFSVTVTPHDNANNATTGSAAVTLSAETAEGVAGTGTLSSVLKGTPPVINGFAVYKGRKYKNKSFGYNKIKHVG
jgi:hypothetical protein